jgi:hypothetical protein
MPKLIKRNVQKWARKINGMQLNEKNIIEKVIPNFGTDAKICMTL